MPCTDKRSAKHFTDRRGKHHAITASRRQSQVKSWGKRESRRAMRRAGWSIILEGILLEVPMNYLLLEEEELLPIDPDLSTEGAIDQELDVLREDLSIYKGDHRWTLEHIEHIEATWPTLGWPLETHEQVLDRIEDLRDNLVDLDHSIEWYQDEIQRLEKLKSKILKLID